MKNIKQTPEFRALESVYNAMKPLDPENRRRVIEAIHTLLDVSPGNGRSDGGSGQCEEGPEHSHDGPEQD